MRVNEWSSEEELILAEVTLRYIREGKLQWDAYENVSERIGRTAHAVKQRWSTMVSKRYDAAIQIARAQRIRRKSPEPTLFIKSNRIHQKIQALEDQLKNVFRCLDNIKSEIE